MKKLMENKNVVTMCFILVLSLLFYIIHGVFLATFVINLPLVEDAITDEFEYGEGKYTYTFKNELEQAKYYHNEDMLQLNKYFLYGLTFLAFISSYIIQVYLPSRYENINLLQQLKVDNIVVSFAIAFISIYVIPIAFGLIIPHNRLMPFLTPIYEAKQAELLQKYKMIFLY